MRRRKDKSRKLSSRKKDLKERSRRVDQKKKEVKTYK